MKESEKICKCTAFSDKSCQVPCRLCTTNTLTEGPFKQRPCKTDTVVHTNSLTHRHLYRQTDWHTDASTQRPFYTQTLLHTVPFTHRDLYRQTQLHTESLLHRDPFTHRDLYRQTQLHTETLLHTDPFTHRHLY